MPAILIASLLMASLQLNAQDGWERVQSIPAGQPIRVHTATNRVQGTMRSASADSVELASKDGKTSSLSKTEVKRVDAKTRSHRKRSTVIGAAIGAAAGIATYVSLGQLLRNEGGENTEILIAVPAAVGAGIGALLPSSGYEKVYERPESR